MKNLRSTMDSLFDRLDARWRKLPVRQQRTYTWYFFIGYLLLTVGVICKVGSDAGKHENTMTIRHIESPVIQDKKIPAVMQDTLSTTIKDEFYERK